MSDLALPLPIPDVATTLAEAHDRRHAAGQQLFQFLIDVDDVDLREDTIQQQLFDSNAREAAHGLGAAGGAFRGDHRYDRLPVWRGADWAEARPSHRALEAATGYRDIFGEGNFFLELPEL